MELTVRIFEILLDVPLLFPPVGFMEVLTPELLRRGLDGLLRMTLTGVVSRSTTLSVPVHLPRDLHSSHRGHAH